MEVTKCVKFQILRYKGFKVGIFRISPIVQGRHSNSQFRRHRQEIRVRLKNPMSKLKTKSAIGQLQGQDGIVIDNNHITETSPYKSDLRFAHTI